MRCSRCSAYVDETMKYCPYCGYGLVGRVASASSQTPQIYGKTIEEYIKNKEYEKVLREADRGNVSAKYYFLKEIRTILDQQDIRKSIEEGTKYGFVQTAYGWWAYCKSWTSEAVKYIGAATKELEPAAMTIMAKWILKKKEFVEDNSALAIQYIKEAANMNYPEALYLLGIWTYRGENGITEDPDLGYDLIEKAAYWGCTEAIEVMTKEDEKWLEATEPYDLNKEDFAWLKKRFPVSQEQEADEKQETDEKQEESASVIVPTSSEAMNKIDEFHKILEKNHIDDLFVGLCDVKDYFASYHKIKDMQIEEANKNIIIQWICDRMNTTYNIKIKDIERYEKEVYNKEHAQQIIDEYTQKEDFLNLWTDMKKNGILINPNTKESIQNYANEMLRKKLREEYDNWAYYDYMKSKIKIGIVLGIITFIIGFYFPILFIGTVICIICYLCFKIKGKKYIKSYKTIQRVKNVIYKG